MESLAGGYFKKTKHPLRIYLPRTTSPLNGPGSAEWCIGGSAQLNEISTLYIAEKYREAIPLMEKMVTSADAPAQLYLGLGIAKLENR